MKWLNLSDEEREQWRSLEYTQAFVDALRELDAEFGTDALNALLAGRTHDATVLAGKQEGIVRAFHLANFKDKG